MVMLHNVQSDHPINPSGDPQVSQVFINHPEEKDDDWWQQMELALGPKEQFGGAIMCTCGHPRAAHLFTCTIVGCRCFHFKKEERG